LRGKLGALATGPAALLPRTIPSINGLYGHGLYGNGMATAMAMATALQLRIRNAGNQASKKKNPAVRWNHQNFLYLKIIQHNKSYTEIQE